ncbi:MAG: BrnA antitoxin family protein [Chlorobium sp.]|nr:BrnA antitoxin family protein [Chlorobium sp.]MCW8815371.1 BrnA antitoxin family protein [Chlorobium sp.]MCW8818847.1 BrnA antitoxin family protein [Ignavibacteriaceae bacterium]
MKKQKKTVPEFRSEQNEREFWATHDSSEYIDWKKAGTAIFPDLKPTMKTISLRLPEQMLNRIKVLANERDVPYQSLLKMFLKERIDREYEPKRNKPRSSRKANA